MTDELPVLSAREIDALEALLSNKTVTLASTACGVPPRTLRDWMRKPHFAEALRTVQRARLEHAVARLSDIASKAVDTIESVLDDVEAPAASRVQAAALVLRHGHEVVVSSELARRIEELDAAEQARKP